MLIAEAVVLQTLKNGFAALGADPTFLNDLFDNASPLDVSRLQTVLGGKRLSVILGFPPVGAKDTTVALTLGAAEETDQFVGSDWSPQVIGLGDANFFQESRSAIFQYTWRVTVYSSNQDLAVYLAYIVKYILLTQRAFLDEAGLKEQRISMGDFEPTPSYLPDVVYVRAVMFSAKVRDIFQTNVAFAPITDIEVTVNTDLIEGWLSPQESFQIDS